MGHQFKIVYAANFPFAVFEGDNEEAWVLGAYLKEASSFLHDMLEAVAQASTADHLPVQFTGNEVSLDLYPDRAVISALWIKDTEDKECEVVVPLEEARRLLTEWQSVLDEHRRQPRQT